MTIERPGGVPPVVVRAVQDVALFVGPVLELMHRLDAPISGRLIEAVVPRGRPLGPSGRSPARLLAGMAAALVLVASLWPVTFRVVAPARVEGIDQRIVAAPVDGFVARVAVRPGTAVRAGQELVALDDRELQLRRDRLAADMAQQDKLYREAFAGDDAGAIVKARAALASLQAQHALVLADLERTVLRAPFDGVLIEGDLAGSIGAPVARVLLDTTGEVLIVGRYGGEEFGVVAPDLDPPAMAALGERIRAAVESGVGPRIEEVPNMRVTISVGAAALNDPADTLAVLLDRADQALYRAKRGGRNRVVHADLEPSAEDADVAKANA